ncbi:MAG: hypothetical protein JNG90_03935 [Planctomycetaceae bacterium]|nr:hypothetical protein [Planctomycetaceae bacterium]
MAEQGPVSRLRYLLKALRAGNTGGERPARQPGKSCRRIRLVDFCDRSRPHQV